MGSEKQNKPILVIAEKPSVAQGIAKVLGAYRRHDGYMEGNGYIVSWCFGHLAEYAMPDAYDERYAKWRFEDLPIIPSGWKLEVARDKKSQVKVIKELFGKCSAAVNACDAGREGELIFRNAYEIANASIPVKRLWISSLEEESIRKGFDKLREGSDFDNLYAAALCRAKADWLVGMNESRAFSTVYNTRISVGRVQSPTLAMIVDRQHRIDRFIKEPYYKVTVKGSGIAAVSENIESAEGADKLAERCEGQSAIITKVEKQAKRENPPKLYDLTSIQRDANRLFGYTAQQTLDILQELYESKLVTYPRTDSRYITSDMERSVTGILDILSAGFSVAGKADEKNVQRLICDSKVTDHHAIIPTMASMEIDVMGLEEQKKNIYLMTATRLASAAAGVKHMEKTLVEVTCAGELFKANSMAVITPGFQSVEDAFMAGYVKPEKQEDGNHDISVISILDELFEGKELEHPVVEKSKHFTQPPKPYTEETLLAAMEKAGSASMDDDVERKGLGTPATRAGVIEKLIRTGYIERKGRKLFPTKRGTQVAGVLFDQIKSPDLTAEWENRLLDVERGKESGEAFLRHIFDEIDGVLEELSHLPRGKRDYFNEENSIGNCPACGNRVITGKGNYHCSNTQCRFILWEDNRFLSSMKAKLGRDKAQALVRDGRVKMEGLYSQKTGKTFDADLVLSVGESGGARFALEFTKRKKKQ